MRLPRLLSLAVVSLSLSLLAPAPGVLAAPDPSSPAQPSAEPTAAGAGRELQDGHFDARRSRPIDSRTTSTRREWLNEDGTVTVEVAPAPVRFQDARGAWRDIDLTVQGGGDRPFAARSADRSARLSPHATGDVVAIDTPAGRFAVRHPDATGVQGQVVDGRGVIYRGGLSGGRDLVERLTVSGFEEEVVLPSPSAAPSYRVQFVMPSGVTARAAVDGVEFLDGDGRVVGSFGGGLAYDSSGSAARGPAEAPVTTRLGAVAGRVAELVVGVEATWLADPARVFPVVIDPYAMWSLDEVTAYNSCQSSFNSYVACDTYGNSDNPTGAYHAQTQIRTGSTGAQEAGAATGVKNRERAFIQFATDSLFGSGLDIVQAQLKVYNFEASQPVYSRWTTAYALNSRGVLSSTTWGSPSGVERTPASASGAWQYFGQQNGYVSFNVLDTVKRWSAGSLKPYGFALLAGYKLDPSADNAAERDYTYFRKYYSGEAGTATSPLFYMTYNRPPTSASGKSPADGVLLTTTTPTLEVNAGRDPDGYALSYQFNVSDAATGAVVHNSPWQSGTTYPVPAGLLGDGKRYRWSVDTKDNRGLAATSSFVWSFTVDLTAPVMTELSSTSHADPNLWYRNSSIAMSWLGEDASGIAGYSYLLDQTSGTRPDTTSEGTGRTPSPALSRGTGTYWFHVAALDAAGRWGEPRQMQVNVDVTAPTNPGSVRSTSHVPAGPAVEDRTVDMAWDSSNDGHSGVAGYSWTFNQSLTQEADHSVDTTNLGATSPLLADGQWYAHVRAVDRAGNVSNDMALGPFTIAGVTAPPAPTARAGDAAATVDWQAPVRAQTVTGYQIIASPGGQSVTTGKDARTVVVPNLTNGVTYTFTVRGLTPDGPGPSSPPSNAVTPQVVVQEPPNTPSAPVPANGAVLPSAPTALSVLYSDPNQNNGTVAFTVTSLDSGKQLFTLTSPTTASGAVASTPDSRLSALVDGAYRWTATATDSTGRTSQPATFDFTIRTLDGYLGYDGRGGWSGAVNTALGALTHAQTDVVLNTAGPELSAARSYSSLNTRDSGLSAGWTHTFGIRWTGDRAGNIAIDWADGRREVHTAQPDGTYRPPTGFYTALTADGAGGFRLTTKDRAVYAFSSTGALVSVGDAAGRTLRLSYLNGQLDRVTDPASGRYLDYDWTGSRISRVASPPVSANGGALVWNYTYTGDRLTSVCTPRSTPTIPVCWRYGYDNSRGLLTAVITPRGNAELTAGYGSDGRIAHTTTGTGNRTTFTYPATRTTRITDPRGHVTVHEHDTSFRLVADTSPTGSVIRSAYDPADNRIKVTDALGHVAAVDYDGRGNPVKVTNPAGESTYSTFANDLLVVTRDGRSASATDDTYRTDLGYNPLRNRTSETSPPTADHGRISRTWTFSNGTEAAVGGGTVPPGLELTATDGAGRVTTFGYDKGGDLRQRTDPGGLTTRYDYDELGRKTTQTVLDAAADADAREAVTRWAYDGHSNTVTTTNPAVRNDITGVTHQARARAVYDANDNLIEQHDQDLTGGDTTRTSRHDFDDADREIRTLDALGHETRRTFDPAGNVATVTDPEARTYRIDYEPRNLPSALTLLKFVQDPVAGSAPRDLPVARMTYDAAGRQETVTDALGRLTRTAYDAADRPKRHSLEGYRDLDGTARTVTLSAVDYDKAGHPVRSTVGGERNPLTVSTDYDPAGWITREVTDPVSLVRTASYNRDRVGNETVRTLTAAGTARTEQVRSRYDAAHRLIEQTVENGEVDLTSRTGYDQRGNPISQTGPRGTTPGAVAADHTTTTSFDVLGRPRRLTAPPVIDDDGSETPPGAATRPVTITGYDTWGNRTHLRDPRGHVTATGYDALNRRSRVQHPAYSVDGASLEPVEVFGYDRVGNLVRQTSRRGHTTEWIFDALNRAVSQTDPAADGSTARGVTRTGYDDVGNAISTTDPTGAVTQTGYDNRDRPRSLTRVVRDPDGDGPATGGRFTSQTDYDDQGHVQLTRGATLYGDRNDDPATAVDERYAVTRMQRNAAGELLRLTDPTGAVSSSSYDLAGRMTDQTDPVGRRTSTSYDLAGRPTAVRRYAPDGTLLTTSTSTPDPAGNIIATVTPRGHVPGADPDRFRTSRTFDALNRLLSVTTPVGGDSAQDITTGYGYDLSGNHTRTTDGRGNTTRTTYQPWNLPEQSIEPATTAYPTLPDRTWTFRYDAGGLPVREDQPGQVSLERSFDALARLTSESGEGPDTARASRRFGYDLTGRRTTASHPDGTVTLRYDDRSLLVGSDGPAGTAAFGFDADGRMTERRDAAGSSRFSYTPRGELASAQDSLSNLARTWTFTPAGQVEDASSSAGSTRRYTYDDLARLTGDQHKTGDNTVRAEQRYSYDADGNLTSQTVTLPDPALEATDPIGSAAALAAATNLSEGRHAYCYDHTGRIVRWDRPLSTDPASPDDADDCGALNSITDSADVTDYTWDRAGNRTSAGQQRYSHDERNRLLTGPGGSYTWTARGTLASSTDGAQAREYTFDGLGRQTQAGGVNLTYDALDRIAVRTPVTDPGTPTPAGAQFVYAGLEIDPVDDQTNDPAGADLGARYARSPSGRLLALSQNGSQPRQAVLNRHGDLTALTDNAGVITDSKIYDPFGQTTADSISGLTLPTVGFQGDWTDPTTNQVWMGARWYDPTNASFTRRDTVQGELGTPVSLNRYTYGQNNPLYYLDPDGRRVVAADQESHEDRAVSLAHANGLRGSGLRAAYEANRAGQRAKDPDVFVKSAVRQLLPEYSQLQMWASDRGQISPDSATKLLLELLVEVSKRHGQAALDSGNPVEYLRAEVRAQVDGRVEDAFNVAVKAGEGRLYGASLMATQRAQFLNPPTTAQKVRFLAQTASWVPGVGAIASFGLAVEQAAKGNLAAAGLEAVGAIPGAKISELKRVGAVGAGSARAADASDDAAAGLTQALRGSDDAAATARPVAAEAGGSVAPGPARDALGRFTSGAGGESAATAAGRSAHLNYENTLGGGDYVFNRAMPGSRLRPDAVSFSERTVRELKPDSPGAISDGWRQVNGYRTYLEELTGQPWTAYVDVYKP